MVTMMDTGNRIAAKAAQLARPEVVAAYPITPQTVSVEELARHVESGELDAEFIRVESEHSAMAACIGASAGGVRTFTATSSHGLLLMHEMLHWAALSRLPIVMVNVNRAIGPGWNIWTDETDALSQRDTGWLQFFCCSNQEILDTVIQAFKLAEHREVQLPVMVNYSGFILSHTTMPVEIPEQKAVDTFLPRFAPFWKLDVNNPVTHGNVLSDEYYMEVREDMQRGQDNARRLIPEIADEWRERFGTYHGGLIEEYQCEDAELLVVAMGTIGAEARTAVDSLRAEGSRVGLARVRVTRPFPRDELRRLAEGRTLLTVDRNISIGSEAWLYSELKAALYGQAGSPVHGFVAGLGGRDVTYEDLIAMVRKVQGGQARDNEWWDLHEPGGD